MRPIDADAMFARLEEWNTSDSIDKALYNFTLHRILEQPTIEPERKKGKWVADEKRFGDDGYHCDQCGAILEGDTLVWRNNYYCYHCGADMRKEREDADNSQI